MGDPRRLITRFGHQDKRRADSPFPKWMHHAWILPRFFLDGGVWGARARGGDFLNLGYSGRPACLRGRLVVVVPSCAGTARQPKSGGAERLRAGRWATAPVKAGRSAAAASRSRQAAKLAPAFSCYRIGCLRWSIAWRLTGCQLLIPRLNSLQKKSKFLLCH